MKKLIKTRVSALHVDLCVFYVSKGNNLDFLYIYLGTPTHILLTKMANRLGNGKMLRIFFSITKEALSPG